MLRCCSGQVLFLSFLLRAHARAVPIVFLDTDDRLLYLIGSICRLDLDRCTHARVAECSVQAVGDLQRMCIDGAP